MNRRDFLQTTVGMAAAAAALKDGIPLLAADAAPVSTGCDDIPSPLDTKVNIKP